ncbi:hypothetical protein NN561_017727 [Cricetulus griseus]
MVPSQEEPVAAAARGKSQVQPPGPAPSDEAPLPCPGPSDGPDVAAEKVEVELSRSTGDESPVPPEGGWGWLVMLAAMWCNGSVFGIQNAYGVLFVSMKDTFRAKDGDNMAFKTGGALRRAEGTRGAGTHTAGAWCVLWCWEGVSGASDPSRLQPGASVWRALYAIGKNRAFGSKLQSCTSPKLLSAEWAPRSHSTFL